MMEIITSAAVLILFAGISVESTEALSLIPPQRCMLACPPGQVLHAKECRCVSLDLPDCPLIRCPYLFIPCDKYKVDRNGCRTCQCQCSSFLSRCPTDCEHGTEFTTNSNGCRVCQCKDKPSVCPKIKCEKQCSHGTVTDKDGCPTCQCADCPLIRCPYQYMPCDKYKVDKNGCPTCQCQCSSFLAECPTHCEHGTEFTTNSNGCRVCQCKDKPSLCPLVKCEKPCLYGTVTGKDGCPTCQCKPHICPPVMCEIACLYGFEKDEHGCLKCQCKSRISPPQCGPVCAIYCPFGNVLDSRGCPTCRCKSGTIKERRDFY